MKEETEAFLDSVFKHFLEGYGEDLCAEMLGGGRVHSAGTEDSTYTSHRRLLKESTSFFGDGYDTR